MRKGDPKSLSDEELAQICTAARLKEWLLVGGCLGSVAGVLLLIEALLTLGGVGTLFGLGFAVTAFIAAHEAVAETKRPYREELALRRGLGPWPQYVAKAEAILREKEADWVLLFAVWGFPHDGFCWLQLTLKEEPPASARASMRISPQAAGVVFKRVETDVPEDTVQDLMRLLKTLDLAALSDVPDFGNDGALCHLAVLRREPWFVASASGNLMGFTAELSQHPAAITCSKLWDIARRRSPAR